MEVAGLVVGTVALASLFSTCVECWDYFDSVRSYGREYELLATKLEVERTRFMIWGDLIGLLNSDDNGRALAPDSEIIVATIERTLNCILAILQDSEALESRYGLEQAKTTEVHKPNSPTLGKYQIAKFRVSYKQFRARVKGSHAQTSLLSKTRWAIHDRSKFGILIEDLKQLIDGLKDVTDSYISKTRQHDAIVKELDLI